MRGCVATRGVARVFGPARLRVASYLPFFLRLIGEMFALPFYLSPNIFQALSQGSTLLAGLAIAPRRFHSRFYRLFPFLGQVDRLCFPLAKNGQV